MASNVTKSKVDQLWQEALVEFRKLTNKDLGEIPKISPDDLRRLIEARAKQNDTEENKRRAKAKDTGLKILACINKLGEVAVQGVSTVFGAADICFKGISLLLDVPKRIREFHEVIDKIFIEIAPVLSQFKIYGRSEQFQAMDEDLLIAIHHVMISLVTICAKAINIEHGGKWQKFKAYASRALCDDEELNEELEKFQMLVKGQQNVQGTVVLESVLETKMHIATIMKSTNDISSDLKGIKDRAQKKEAESSKQTLLTKIKNSLGIDPKDPDTSKATYEDFIKKKAPGTGTWFKPMPDYESWADMKASAQGTNSFLLLTGGPGFGKSFSMASIIDDLGQQTTKPTITTQAHRSLISFYFFPARSGRAGDVQYPVEMALKCIAVQLAEQDEAYAKSIGDIEQLKDAKPSKLWEALRLGSPMARTTHFILLDALDNLSRPEQEELLKLFHTIPKNNTNEASLRVLATGQSSVFEDLQTVEALSLREIQADHSTMEPEFQHYIRHRLQAPTMLPGPDLEGKREGIEKKIMHSECSFQTIQATLGAVEGYIASSKSDEELDKLLEDSTRDTSVLLVDTIEKLQNALDMGQIGWVNELLIWVLFGEESMAISQLEAAFFLRGKALPIQGLENFINSRLKKLITTGPQGLAPTEENLAKVVTKPRELSQGGPDNKTISLEIKINNANISTVQRFLWDLTKFSTLDSFSFKADDAAAQVAQSRGIIRVNKTDASLAIVETFFELLKDDPNGKSESIQKYLVDYLADHLRTLRTAEGDDKLTASEAGSIGKRIFELFDYPDAAMKKHWELFRRSQLFICEENMEEYWEWIQMDATLALLSGKERDHIGDLKKDPHWERKLLKPTMRMVAKMWLRDREQEVYWVLDWLNSFLSRIKKEDRRAAAKSLKSSAAAAPGATVAPLKSPETTVSNTNTPDSSTAADTPDRSGSPSPSVASSTEDDDGSPFKVEVADAASWCQEILELKDEELDALWFERLGQSYKDTWPSSYKDAIEQFRKAEQISGSIPSWQTLVGLSHVLLASSSANIEEARAVHDRAMNLYKDSTLVTAEKKVSQLRELAWWYDNYKQPQKALELLEEALLLAPEDPDIKYDMVGQLLKLEREDRARELVAKTVESKEEGKGANKGLTALGSFVRSIAKSTSWSRSDVFFWRVISIIEATGNFDALVGALNTNISVAETDDEEEQLHAVLITFKGLMHMHKAQPEDIQQVLECCKQAREAARQRLKDTHWMLERIIGKTTLLTDSFHFNQATGRGRLPGITTLATEDHLAAIKTSVAEYEKLPRNNYYERRLSISKCYLASYYCQKSPPELEESRKVFASDMVRVTNLLSDGDKYNDTDSLLQLSAILLHTGDVQNALACMQLVAPDVTSLDGHVYEILIRLMCPEGGQPAEGTPAHQVLTWATTGGVNLVFMRTEICNKIEKMIEELSDQRGRRPSVSTTKTEDAAATGDDQTDKPADEGAVVGERQEEEDAVTLRQLRTVKRALQLYQETFCGACIGYGKRTWNFDNDFYACKYCYDMFACGPCLEKLKKADPSKPQALCSPGHDWVRLPKWNVDSWVEGFESKVRVPQVDEKTGEFVEGKEVVSFGEWLKGVLKPWGVGEDKLKWDVERIEGEESDTEEDEDEDEGDEEKEKEKSEGEVVGEKSDGKMNGEKVTVETMAIEKVTVERVTVEEVTDQVEPQQAVAA
ncbi:hypothetical protein QBC40DRAFT_339823 [Triangularia verruculosa]|uniref:Fungal STAND N-terminal Goodbye domain-containing protein n=1 Tax=Triangularia verruculosa TaxID=2587418 RepID=A0AAN6XHT4_9PEZI|nr:hypothetical protein QBC40DRAFT_339823 [Triangularia verruculosa]